MSGAWFLADLVIVRQILHLSESAQAVIIGW